MIISFTAYIDANFHKVYRPFFFALFFSRGAQYFSGNILYTDIIFAKIKPKPKKTWECSKNYRVVFLGIDLSSSKGGQERGRAMRILLGSLGSLFWGGSGGCLDCGGAPDFRTRVLIFVLRCSVLVEIVGFLFLLGLRSA